MKNTSSSGLICSWTFVEGNPPPCREFPFTCHMPRMFIGMRSNDHLRYQGGGIFTVKANFEQSVTSKTTPKGGKSKASTPCPAGFSRYKVCLTLIMPWVVFPVFLSSLYLCCFSFMLTPNASRPQNVSTWFDIHPLLSVSRK